VKKGLAIFFLSIYLVSATEIKELLKIPFMLEHYQEHKAEDCKLSFTDFLSWHYLHNTSLAKDYSKDLQLPFKNVRSGHSFTGPLAPPTTIACQVKPYPKVFSNNRFIAKETVFNSLHISGIFQPPRA
jgi:hypothetical protein